MNKLPEDILCDIAQHLDETSFVKLFTCNKQLIGSLNYIQKNKVQIIATKIVPEKGVEWFQNKNIIIKYLDDHFKFASREIWCLNGNKHRDNDLPAVIYHTGSKEWYKNGKLHRDNDLPAVIYGDGTQRWFQNGLLHRDNDLPAVICCSGMKKWGKNGQLHRDNDLPAVIANDGTNKWYQNDELHRDNDLPAVIKSDGTKEWYLNGIQIK